MATRVTLQVTGDQEDKEIHNLKEGIQETILLLVGMVETLREVETLLVVEVLIEEVLLQVMIQIVMECLLFIRGVVPHQEEVFVAGTRKQETRRKILSRL